MLYFNKKGRGKQQNKGINNPYRTPNASKEYAVKVINPKTGRIKTVRFGDPNMRFNAQFPKRRASYCARSKPLSKTGDKTSPNYWSRKRWKCKKP